MATTVSPVMMSPYEDIIELLTIPRAVYFLPVTFIY